MAMKVDVKESTLVRPQEGTPKRSLWNSDVDLMHVRHHVRTVQFFEYENYDKALEVLPVLKESLGKVLVPYYPVAGRLGRDEKGRVEIQCNAAGVMFSWAETDSTVDELKTDGVLTPSSEISKLVPTVDYSSDLSSYPLILIQVTFFKCGGICLGTGVHHLIGDGLAFTHFLNSWADTARGLPITQPSFDRTTLRDRTLSLPLFDHPEFDSTSKSTLGINENHTSSKTKSDMHFRITFDQIKRLKIAANTNSGSKHSSYEILAAHVWRCACRARGLDDSQTTRMDMVIDGRSRLYPPLQQYFIGNAAFPTTAAALSGDIMRESLSDTANRIQIAIKRIDDEYIRSALAFLRLNSEAVESRQRKGVFGNPNLSLVSWQRMPMLSTDFGWGPPTDVVPASFGREGKGYVVSSPDNNGVLSLFLCLESDAMEIFKKLFNEF